MKKLYLLATVLLITSHLFSQRVFTEPDMILPGHTDDLEVLTISPSGNWMATGSRDKLINIYKADSTMEFYKSLGGFMTPLSALRFNNQGRLLAASSNASITLYDSVFKPIRVLDGHQRNVNTFLFDNANKFLFSGADDGNIIQWDLATGLSARTIVNGQPVNTLAQTADSRLLIVGDGGPKIKLYNQANAQLVKTLDGHTDAVNAIDVSPDNLYLLSGSNDKSARLWELKTGREIRKFAVDCWKVTSVAFSSDGKYAVTGCNDGSVKVWEVSTGKMVSKIEANGNYVRDILFIRNNHKMAIAAMLRGSSDFGLRIWPTGLDTWQPTLNVPVIPVDTIKKPVAIPPKNLKPVRK